MIAAVRRYAGLVAFSHTIFSLPFAASAVVLARAVPHVPLTIARAAAMLACMATARTSAMAFNRWADRDIDAMNPRTKSRHVPSGQVKAGEALALALGSGALFIAFAATLGFWPGVLSPIVLAVLLGYSYAKRFTWTAHAWLGVASALAPGGAWLACGATPNAGILALMAAVVTWLFGFDVLYSLQDATFDRENGLNSVPARFGLGRSLVMSGAAHVLTAIFLALTGLWLHRGAPYFAGVAIVTALLVWEHAIVGKGDLRKIDKAFFDVNAYVSLGFFALVLLDEALR
ncbi:MAG TPA: 4-hydroxybenzoate octaprenyltransferase [Polyangiaceae bacterium]|jgi:4-hydroxybenzoate polyprenyltransferase